VINGHSHNYERFAAQTPAGVRDDAHGIREFVVGTGGEDLQAFLPTTAPNSQVKSRTSFGVLELTLNPTGYAWRFVPAAGGTLNDSGTGTCH
jgi:acid phosphatase type 7